MAVSLRQEILSTAQELLGAPAMKYQHGAPELGQSPETGFDCSGFVRYVLAKSGVHVPSFLAYDNTQREARHANELWDTYGAAVHEARALPGDLVFFSRQGLWPTHIGIYMGRDVYIHSPGKDDHQVELAQLVHQEIPVIEDDDYRQVFAANPIGFKSPTVANTANYRVHQKVLQ